MPPPYLMSIFVIVPNPGRRADVYIYFSPFSRVSFLKFSYVSPITLLLPALAMCLVWTMTYSLLTKLTFFFFLMKESLKRTPQNSFSEYPRSCGYRETSHTSCYIFSCYIFLLKWETGSSTFQRASCQYHSAVDGAGQRIILGSSLQPQ